MLICEEQQTYIKVYKLSLGKQLQLLLETYDIFQSEQNLQRRAIVKYLRQLQRTAPISNHLI